MKAILLATIATTLCAVSCRTASEVDPQRIPTGKGWYCVERGTAAGCARSEDGCRRFIQMEPKATGTCVSRPNAWCLTFEHDERHFDCSPGKSACEVQREHELAQDGARSVSPCQEIR